MSLSRSWQFIGGVESPWYRWFDRVRQGLNRRLVDFLSDHLPDGQGAAAFVLEAGSGPGSASSLFARKRRVGLAVCLDLDESALQEARRRDPALPTVVGDMTRMPFLDGSFDLVFNSSTVEHLDDPVPAVAEMQRVCRDGGRVFVGVPNLTGPLWFQPLVAKTSLGIWLGTVFSRAGLERLLRTAGLRPIRHTRYFWRMFVGSVARKAETTGARTLAGETAA